MEEREPNVLDSGPKVAGAKTFVVTARLPSQWEAQCNMLIASDFTPYKSVTDIVRHGVQAVLRAWEDEFLGTELSAVYVQDRMMRRILDAEDNYLRIAECFNLGRQIVNKLRADNQGARVQTIIGQLREEAEKLQDEYWRVKYTAMIAELEAE